MMFKCLALKKWQLLLIFVLKGNYFRKVFFWVGITVASESQQAMDWILNSEDHIPAKLFLKEQKP